jgi:hypothetical protein
MNVGLWSLKKLSMFSTNDNQFDMSILVHRLRIIESISMNLSGIENKLIDRKSSAVVKTLRTTSATIDMIVRCLRKDPMLTTNDLNVGVGVDVVSLGIVISWTMYCDSLRHKLGSSFCKPPRKMLSGSITLRARPPTESRISL